MPAGWNHRSAGRDIARSLCAGRAVASRAVSGERRTLASHLPGTGGCSTGQAWEAERRVRVSLEEFTIVDFRLTIEHLTQITFLPFVTSTFQNFSFLTTPLRVRSRHSRFPFLPVFLLLRQRHLLSC